MLHNSSISHKSQDSYLSFHIMFYNIWYRSTVLFSFFVVVIVGVKITFTYIYVTYVMYLMFMT